MNYGRPANDNLISPQQQQRSLFGTYTSLSICLSSHTSSISAFPLWKLLHCTLPGPIYSPYSIDLCFAWSISPHPCCCLRQAIIVDLIFEGDGDVSGWGRGVLLPDKRVRRVKRKGCWLRWLISFFHVRGFPIWMPEVSSIAYITPFTLAVLVESFNKAW